MRTTLLHSRQTAYMARSSNGKSYGITAVSTEQSPGKTNRVRLHRPGRLPFSRNILIPGHLTGVCARVAVARAVTVMETRAT